jgi:hypothetical protein
LVSQTKEVENERSGRSPARKKELFLARVKRGRPRFRPTARVYAGREPAAEEPREIPW